MQESDGAGSSVIAERADARPAPSRREVLRMSWLKDLKRTLKDLAEPMHVRAERRTASGLAARLGVDADSTEAGIKDISNTGIHLLTEKRFPIGELLTVTLQTGGAGQQSPELQFSVQARVERQDEDGIALSFVLPSGLDREFWGVLLQGVVLFTDENQIALMFNIVRTVFFICRLCESGAGEAIGLLSGDLDSGRIETLIKIAASTEKLLALEPDAERMRADPKLVANILRQGAWAANDGMMQLWSGLLASSCSVDAPDDSNQVFVNLLVHITPEEAKIFTHACERALGSAEGSGSSPAGSIVLTPKEMVEITGVHSLSRNVTDVDYLFNLGLLEKPVRSTSYMPTESFDITPSSLGLELYKHCHGSREKVAPQIVEKANAHLVNFMPQGQTTVNDQP